ncbi:DNA excision repair protein ERCC-1-like isoform X1 [Mytilus trossulus]|uniref:DNA excision repair protein ERCC-1-like isoform X1 n=1 Tax=Mytilus trossulus TaxID=6551 RepID=UPI0030060311
MAEKRRFHIPSAAEIEDGKKNVAESFKPTSIFKTYREQKKNDPSDEIQNKKPKLPDVSIKKNSATAEVSSRQSSLGNLQTVKSSNSGSRSTTSIDQFVKPSDSRSTFIKPSTSKDNAPKINTFAKNLKKEDITPGNDSVAMTNLTEENAPKLAIPGKTSSLLVHQRQRGNPILKFVRNVPWEFGDIVPDYVMGQTTCALYLSLRYHQLNPNYIHDRLKQLGRSYELRVMLVQIDIKEPHHLLRELAKICILADCTLILAFSTEEAGRYLESYKVYENKPPDAIMEKTDQDFMAKMTDCLTNIKSVNKTDVATLISTFGSLKDIAEASQEDLSFCPGFGPQKAKRVHDLFKEPFLRANKNKDQK